MECVWTRGSLLGLPSRLSAWSRKIKIKIERWTGVNDDIYSGTFCCGPSKLRGTSTEIGSPRPVSLFTLYDSLIAVFRQ
jgi:hypothetical protein